MCLGGGPKAPDVKYKGPSQEEIDAQQEALDDYEQKIQAQQNQFQTQLQQQIDAANEGTAALKAEYKADLAAEKEAAAAALGQANAASQAEQVGAYAVMTEQVEPENAETTKAIDKKKKPKANLKISTAGAASEAGSGLNLGI